MDSRGGEEEAVVPNLGESSGFQQSLLKQDDFGDHSNQSNTEEDESVPSSNPPMPHSSSVSVTATSPSAFSAASETCPNQQNITDVEFTALNSKPPANQSSTSSIVAIKLLVSNNMAGSIIGRSGQTISELQAKSKSRIKLGQAGDCYPGTADRACLIQGPLDNVKKAVGLVLQKLYELQLQQVEMQLGRHILKRDISHRETDQSSEGGEKEKREAAELTDHLHFDDGKGREVDSMVSERNASQQTKFAFAVKVLVPMPSCGMLIGRGGSNIKAMAETSGVSSIRLSPKDAEATGATPSPAAMLVAATSERIVTITGHDLSSCVKCLNLMLSDFIDNPDICRYSNMTTSYSKLPTAGQSAYLTTTQTNSGPLKKNILTDNTVLTSTQINDRTLASSASSYPTPSSDVSALKQQAIIQIHPQQQALGTSDHNQQQPIYVVATNPQSSLQTMYGHLSQQQVTTAQTGGVHPRAPTSSSASASHALNVSADQLSQIQGSSQSSDTNAGMIILDSSAIVTSSKPGLRYVTKQHASQHKNLSMQIAVSDAVIGAVLGKGGQTLSQLQSDSNTRIKISQRGVFVPGTSNRIVTISGPSEEHLKTAQFLINQRIARSASSARSVFSTGADTHRSGTGEQDDSRTSHQSQP